MVLKLLKLITYDGKRPNASDIKANIIKNRSYSFLVATKALEKVRLEDSILPSHQKKQSRKIPTPNNKRDYPMAVFNPVLREWIGKQGAKIASRGEEKTMISRAIKRVADKDESLKKVLKQDLDSWVKALADLASNGHDLTNGIPNLLKSKLVNPFVGMLLEELQKEYYREFMDNDKRLFEKEAREQIPHLPLTEVIIMEGFTFFTPLQKFFVNECHRLGSEVVFIVPFNKTQEKGFARIKTTYFHEPDFNTLTHEHWTNPPVSKKEDIMILQKHLFGNPFLKKEIEVRNVNLVNYPNRDREILSCIETLKEWFDGDFKPSEVAIVVRNLHEFKEIFQDLVNAAQLTYKNEKGEMIPVTFPTPSRLLLLTPVGRFILTLYDIWDENELHITNEQLETVLSSGWLGASIQDSTIEFRAVKHQFFLHCETRRDWTTALDELERLRLEEMAVSERMPLTLVTEKNIQQWRKSLGLLEEICKRLFQNPTGGIADHIKILQDQLNLLEVDNIRQHEQDVLQKIQDVFNELQELYAIEMTTSEFGEALHALVSKKVEDDEEDDEGHQDQESMLWIATPEGIDGLERKAILYLAVDNQHVPGQLPMSWPFFDDGRNVHLQKERYMFLTVVRASIEKLVISCCRNDGNRKLEPSMYMMEIERLLQLMIETPKIKDLIDATLSPVFIPSQHRTPQRKKSFQLNELVQYGLCPLRYSLEKRHPEAKVYRNDWQLEVFAQGVWMEKTFESLAKYYGPNRNTKGVREVYELFLRAANYVEPNVRRLFPSFDEVTWHGIEQQVQKQFQYYAKTGGGEYNIHFIRGRNISFELLANDKSQQVIKIDIDIPFFINSGSIPYTLLDSISTYEWLLPGKKVELEEVELKKQEDEEDLHLFTNLYEARQWWRLMIIGALASGKQRKSSYEQSCYKHFNESKNVLSLWIEGIWTNKFPANIGDHCKVCPVRTECLGVEMEGTFY
jgi:hypothetical protein